MEYIEQLNIENQKNQLKNQKRIVKLSHVCGFRILEIQFTKMIQFTGYNSTIKRKKFCLIQEREKTHTWKVGVSYLNLFM